MVHHRQHAVRFSRRLLRAMERAMDRGVVAHGELFASTFCLAHPKWCKTADLRETLSASSAVGAKRLTKGRLPPYARWYRVSESEICPMLIELSMRRGDRSLEERIRHECSHMPFQNDQSKPTTWSPASSSVAEARKRLQDFIREAQCASSSTRIRRAL